MARVDPARRAVTATIPVGTNPGRVVAAGGQVWVLDRDDRTLSRTDPQTDTLVAQTIALPSQPGDVLLSAGTLWVASRGDGTVLRMDPRTGRTQGVVRTGGDPVGLAAAYGAVWAATDGSGTLARIDARTGTVTNTIRVGDAPAAVAAGASGGLWVLDPLDATISQVDPRRAAVTATMPVPTGNGRVYTFHLRPGIRYSTGALVRPSDVTRSFERLFKLGSAGAPYYRAISGAAACLKAPATCDLSGGIAADDRAGTVTFHLTQPDPDFLFKQAHVYADVLPASTPGRQARTPLPATGPYMISRYIPGRELLMVRNPRFREWSAAAQPPPPATRTRSGCTPAGTRHMPRPRSPPVRATSCPASARSRPAPPTSSTTAASSGSTRS